MPKISSDAAYGVSTPLGVKPGEAVRDFLMRRFASHEWVRVMNIDDEPYRWQYLPAHAENITFENGSVPMKNTYRESPEVYLLNPGESEVVIGENAYLMIEGLYKKLVSKKALAKTPYTEPGKARNFNWSDPASIESFIDRIYLGKEQLSFDSRSAIQKRIEDEAHKEPPQPRSQLVTRRRGRIRKAAV